MRPDPLHDVDVKMYKLTGLYRDAEAKLQLLVAAAVAPKAQQGRRTHMRTRMAARSVLEGLGTKSMPQVAALIKLAYVRGMRLVDPQAALTPSSEAAIVVLKSSLQSRLSVAQQTVNNSVSDVLRRMTLATVAQQLEANGSEAFVDTMKATGLVGFRDAAGKRWGLEQYAHMAVRTIGRQAVTEGTVYAMAEAGYDLVTVSKTENPGSACLPWDGGTFSLKGTENHPPLLVLPPFHPECEHYIVPAKQAA